MRLLERPNPSYMGRVLFGKTQIRRDFAGSAFWYLEGVETVDVKVVWDPVWTMDRLSDEAREKLAMPLEELEPYRVGRSAA